MYFLWSESGELLYVGQSGNLCGRLYEHNRQRRARFASWFIEDSPLQRLILETIYIVLCRPPLNRAILLRVSHGNLSEIRWRGRP